MKYYLHNSILLPGDLKMKNILFEIKSVTVNTESDKYESFYLLSYQVAKTKKKSPLLRTEVFFYLQVQTNKARKIWHRIRQLIFYCQVTDKFKELKYASNVTSLDQILKNQLLPWGSVTEQELSHV